MLIQLTQKDLEAALKAHIAGQGINLSGKTVTMVFTASRKGNGVSCALDISDVEIPGVNLLETVKPTLAAVPSGPVKVEAKPETPKPTIGAAVQETVRAEAAAVVEAKTEAVKVETPNPFEADPAEKTVEVEAAAPVKPVTSLFG